LVGISTGDDAAVYRLNDDLALVQTVDFFPPIVDDPTAFGEIAVANALSDVYAMGAKPVIALNIVGFPVELPKDILANVLKGGAAKAKEAGVLIAGGHTVDDREPKYGLAVTGVVKPGEQVTNAGAQPGDALVLTKPIGTGIITTAGRDQVVDAEVLSNAIAVMAELNAAASEAMVKVGVNACVDVTGFGLLGHLRGMLDASHVSAVVYFGAIPLLPGAVELASEGVLTGGGARNLHAVEALIDWAPSLSDTAADLLVDPQTSGGLLISLPADDAPRLIAELESAGVGTHVIVGEIHEVDALGAGKLIRVTA
jgi:selenide,water dikinase|tara:strand:- start:518 stop:1453 length:936 start_codon:yes stop_codon:yes gene_type:complete